MDYLFMKIYRKTDLKSFRLDPNALPPISLHFVGQYLQKKLPLFCSFPCVHVRVYPLKKKKTKRQLALI